MDVPDLLPADSGLRAREFAVAPGVVAVVAEATSSVAACPGCGSPSGHVHGRSTRTVADLPWQGRRVVLRLVVRRFRCRNAACPKLTFTERLPAVAPYAQTTARLAETHRAIGFALGGEPGARLAERLAVPTSPGTLLRRVRQAATAGALSPRVLGIDDFAFRRGRTYGTILVDLERRRAVGLLPDREAATVAARPKAHPGAEVITRDRAGASAQAAREAAPAAVQVADRRHLLKNLRDALERALQRRSSAIRALLSGPKADTPAAPVADATAGVALGPSPRSGSESRQRREARFDEVRRLRGEGHSLRGIAAAPGLHYRTVERYARSDACPDWCPGRRRPSALDRFEGHIRRRLSEGCRNRRRIRDGLEVMGYRGGETAVCDHVRRLEAEMGPPEGPAPPAAPRAPADVPSARELAVMAVIRPEDRPEEGRRQPEALRSGDGVIREAVGLAEGFAALARGRAPEGLSGWLARADGSPVAGLKTFASGVRQDEAAVRAGIGSEWSNGPVEGHVNRLKAIKRTMYGRAGFDLLRARVLYAG
jgi:transposase